MTLGKKAKKITISLLLALTATSATAQDLLARQAPVDRRVKKLDSIQVSQIAARENIQNPSAAIYGDEWDNRFANSQAEIPDTFVVDLHHFCMPTPSRVVTSNFGSRWGRQHKGLDIKVYIGDTIRAAFNGKVRIVRYEGGGYGKYIVIRHNNGLETIYGHLSKQIVKENDIVRAGDPIGLGGNTGRSTGSHLHFETRLGGMALNPAMFFDFRNQDVVADQVVYRKSTYQHDSQVATRERGKVGNGGYTKDQIYGEVGHSDDSESTVAATNYDGPERVYYKVVKGDDLESIAKKVGVSVEALCRLNNFRKNQKVRPGQILRYI